MVTVPIVDFLCFYKMNPVQSPSLLKKTLAASYLRSLFLSTRLDCSDRSYTSQGLAVVAIDLIQYGYSATSLVEHNLQNEPCTVSKSVEKDIGSELPSEPLL
jgi:hypothetical protein